MRQARWHTKLLEAVQAELAVPQALTEQEIRGLLLRHEETADLPASATPAQRIRALLKHQLLERVELGSLPTGEAPHPYPARVRYITPNASAYVVAHSLHRRGYFTHGSAAVFHQIAGSDSQRIYLNREQSEKPAGRGLSQESLDRAFARRPRVSAYGYAFGEHQIHLLNGKHTNRLGVVEVAGPDNLPYPTTTIERMLIDVTVRPQYAGGVAGALGIYVGARDRVSVKSLLATLTGLRYVYPYHQAIGFLMSRTGYTQEALKALATLGLQFDFHLVHGAAETRFDHTWRLSYPAELDAQGIFSH